MVTRKIFNRLIGITLAACFVLSACNTAGTTVAPAPTRTASPLPVQPSATATSLQTATATPLPTATETPLPSVAITATLPATATSIVQSVAQVVPSMNAYCRKGPGSGYDAITFLTSGTAYDVIGRNYSNTWWLVQAPGNVTCWTGAQGTSLLGPVEQAPIVLVPPALLASALFVGSYTCDVSTKKHTLSVSLNWALVDKATGYNLYLNGVLLAELGPTVTSYHNNAPLNEDLVYELEAFNDYGVSPRVVTRVPACD